MNLPMPDLCTHSTTAPPPPSAAAVRTEARPDGLMTAAASAAAVAAVARHAERLAGPGPLGPAEARAQLRGLWALLRAAPAAGPDAHARCHPEADGECRPACPGWAAGPGDRGPFAARAAREARAFARLYPPGGPAEAALAAVYAARARDPRTAADPDLTYGEAPAATLRACLERLHGAYGAAQGGGFWDLGSAVGKPALTAALSGLYASARGVELVPELARAAREVAAGLPAAAAAAGLPAAAAVEFVEGDLARAEFGADTRTVFCHATCFGTALMRRVEARLATLRPGAFVLMLGKELRAADFQLLESSRRPASWGVGTFHFYQKLEGGATVQPGNPRARDAAAEFGPASEPAVLASLVRHTRSDAPGVGFEAACAVAFAARTEMNARNLVHLGAVDALRPLLRRGAEAGAAEAAGGDPDALHAAACLAVGHFAAQRGCGPALVASGVADDVLALLRRSASPGVRAACLSIVADLAANGGEGAAPALLAKGVDGALADFARSPHPAERMASEAATVALQNALA